MEHKGIIPTETGLEKLGFINVSNVYWNLNPAQLIGKTIQRGEGCLSDTGALVVKTGEFTGRAPNDRFIVENDKTRNFVWWGGINKKFDENKFDQLLNKICAYMTGKDVFVRDVYACADPKYRLKVRVINELPWHNLFVNNLFIRPSKEELKNNTPDWHIIAAPNFHAHNSFDGTPQHNFVIINFLKKMVLIGGTGYAGEIKKSIFSVLNFILPKEKNVLSMHCSANIGKDGDTAIFFGLSGTGKTTLSADPDRQLIGDDEHGWANENVFNFEGGCYAKCIDLTEEKEPQIFRAIRYGTVVENVTFYENSSTIDFANTKITENTRAGYPIHFIDNIAEPSVGGIPKNIFFLTCDAFGVLPPISKLSAAQAMYYFISGYTAKVAGTEAGITEPKTTFSACFGAPFLPLHPTKYAEMLGEKMKKHQVKVWLINTGWSGGPYGVGKRISLPYTRALITAALTGKLDKVDYKSHPVFELGMPVSCPGVPSEILNPRTTWANKNDYDTKAAELGNAFVKNFEQFEKFANEEIMSAAPCVVENAVT